MHYFSLAVLLFLNAEQHAMTEYLEWSDFPVEGVTAVTFSPDGKYLLAGDAQGRVTLWEPASGKLVTRFACDNQVCAVAFSRDGRRAITMSIASWRRGARHKELALWEIPSGRLVTRLDFKNDFWELPFCLSPDGKRLLTAGKDGLALWDAANGALLKKLVGVRKNAWYRCCCFLPDGKRALVGGINLAIVDLEQDKVLRTFTIPDRTSFTACTPDGRIAVFSSGVALHVIVVATGTCWTLVPDPPPEAYHWAKLSMVTISPDGRRILTAGWQGDADGQIQFWEVASRKLVCAFPKTKARSRAFPLGKTYYRAVSAVALSPDGRWAVSGESFHTLTVWDIGRGQVVRRMSARLILNPTAANKH